MDHYRNIERRTGGKGSVSRSSGRQPCHGKTFEKEYGKGKKWNLTLILSDNSGKCMAKNTYQDICTLLSRVDGHPDRMSHEFGMRLYWA